MKRKFSIILFLIFTLLLIIILYYFFQNNIDEFEIEKNDSKSHIVNISSIEFLQSEFVMKIGEELQLEYIVSPNEVSEFTVSWDSSDDNVVVVDNGKVKAIGIGEAIVKVIASNGKFAMCKIYVNPEIILEKNSIILMDEERSSIEVWLKGISMDDMEWVINNNNINLEVIDKRLNITGKKVGNTVITGIYKRDKSIKVDINVVVREISILMIGNSKTFYEDTGRKLKNISQNGGYSTNVKWFTKEEGVGGKSLQYIYEKKLSEISKSYDYVIMQENVPNMMENYKNFYNGVFNITKAVKSKNKNVKVYLRQSYLREAQNITTIDQYKKSVAYDNVNKIVNDNEIKKITKINLIRDGESMYLANSKYGLDVFADSIYHQTPIGAYLVADCIYATIFNEDPLKNTYVDNDNGYYSGTAMVLRKIAYNYCYYK